MSLAERCYCFSIEHIGNGDTIVSSVRVCKRERERERQREREKQRESERERERERERGGQTTYFLCDHLLSAKTCFESGDVSLCCKVSKQKRHHLNIFPDFDQRFSTFNNTSSSKMFYYFTFKKNIFFILLSIQIITRDY